MSESRIEAWHWLSAPGKLANGDNRKVIKGRTIKHKDKLSLCHSGLHASIRAIDSVQYAPGPIICRVECGGEIIHGDDKLVCAERKCLWTADATDVLRKFARDCALDVIDKWDAPEIVRQYLETGDESIRDAARDAARAAAWDAAWYAARDASWAAAVAAARAAARDAAWDAARYAARYAARDASWAAAGAAQNERLTTALMTLAPARVGGGE